MVNVFLGSATVLITTVIGVISFICGFKINSIINKPEILQSEKEQTEFEKRRVEGLNNMINHALRHKGGAKK